MNSDPYYRAQVAIADLKSAVLAVLGGDMEGTGIETSELARLLGLRTSSPDGSAALLDSILQILEGEGLAKRDESGSWFPQ